MWACCWRSDFGMNFCATREAKITQIHLLLLLLLSRACTTLLSVRYKAIRKEQQKSGKMFRGMFSKVGRAYKCDAL